MNTIADRLAKNDAMQGARIPRNEAYLPYAAIMKRTKCNAADPVCVRTRTGRRVFQRPVFDMLSRTERDFKNRREIPPHPLHGPVRAAPLAGPLIHRIAGKPVQHEAQHRRSRLSSTVVRLHKTLACNEAAVLLSLSSG